MCLWLAFSELFGEKPDFWQLQKNKNRVFPITSVALVWWLMIEDKSIYVPKNGCFKNAGDNRKEIRGYGHFYCISKKKGFRNIRSSRSEVFLGKGVLKIYSEFSGENPCRNVISIKFQSNFSEITLRQGCSPVNLLHIFRRSFYKNTYRGVLLEH